ncbi:NUDIX domain-containing protein [Rhizobium miluonense]|uniref:ADP-ribose pyrophosphatase YjhB, NUDIX family n=1 Tax=Rhizobium miluonense TaxID=411945 RepID=A0A1C3WKR7_9HYPH|nr:NUDIX domain-containing protein [Rhizobium miluonense]SCB40456.1 ADP-ribose pyrophosphatase YjhB, NUDIX family [Rhizobium miluonense]
MSEKAARNEKSSAWAWLFGRALHVYFVLTRSMTLGVRAACFDSEGRIFLVRHSYIAGWHMPGGGVERHETVEQALEKELREEGNLVISGEPQLFHVYFNNRISKRDHVVFYRVEVTQTAPRMADREIVETGFFPRNALPPGTTQATYRRLEELEGAERPSSYW